MKLTRIRARESERKKSSRQPKVTKRNDKNKFLRLQNELFHGKVKHNYMCTYNACTYVCTAIQRNEIKILPNFFKTLCTICKAPTEIFS